MQKIVIDERKISCLDTREIEKIMLNLKLMQPGKKKILVTSTARGEGKTSIALSLCMAMARSGGKILYAAPDSSEFFDKDVTEEKPGASSVGNLDIMLGAYLKAEEAAKDYDYVFFDGNALQDSNESIVYSQLCDLILLIIEANRVGYRELLESKKKLLLGGNKDIMVILNKTKKTYGALRRKVKI